jgi:hypothetical protein
VGRTGRAGEPARAAGAGAIPDAETIPVASHWQIDRLHGNAGNIDRWIRVKTEDLLWQPVVQQAKRSGSGIWNVRYRNTVKGAGVATLTGLIAERTPWLTVRYAF